MKRGPKQISETVSDTKEKKIKERCRKKERSRRNMACIERHTHENAVQRERQGQYKGLFRA